MPQEVIRQRIKFLVQHGELYPQDEKRLPGRRLVIVVLALLALNTFETAAMAIKYFF